MNASLPIPEVERQAAELAALRGALAASAGTFSIGIAVCNSAPLRDHLIQDLRSTCAGVQVLSVPEGTVDVFGWAKEQVGQGEPAALFLVDLDRSIRSDDRTQAALASLNASRDLWRRRFACPVVFWMPEYAAALLSVRARDFWSRKSHQFHFAAEPLAVADRAQAMFHGGVDWAADLEVGRKKIRIAELEQRIAEAGDPPSAELAPHVWAWLNELGVLFLASGGARQALVVFEQALALAERLSHKGKIGAALGNLGLAYAGLGEVRKAIEHYEKQLLIVREIGDRRGEGNALGHLGLAYADLGEVRKAIEYYEKALAIDREIGDRRGEGSALGNLGVAYMNLGEVRKAIEYHERALAIEREIGDRRGEGIILGNLGVAYADLGEVRKAIENYEQALVIARELGDRGGEGNALGNLGLAYADLGEVRKAIEYHEKALVIAREIGDRRGEGIALWNMALAVRELKEPAKALDLARQALAIFEAIEDPWAAKVRKAVEEWGK